MLSLRGSGQFLVLAGLWHGQKVGVVVWGPPAFPTTSESKNRHLAGLGQLDDLAQPQVRRQEETAPEYEILATSGFVSGNFGLDLLVDFQQRLVPLCLWKHLQWLLGIVQALELGEEWMVHDRAGANSNPEDFYAVLFCPFQQGWNFLCFNERGVKKILGHQKDRGFGRLQRLLDLLLPVRPRLDHGVVPHANLRVELVQIFLQQVP